MFLLYFLNPQHYPPPHSLAYASLYSVLAHKLSLNVFIDHWEYATVESEVRKKWKKGYYHQQQSNQVISDTNNQPSSYPFSCLTSPVILSDFLRSLGHAMHLDIPPHWFLAPERKLKNTAGCLFAIRSWTHEGNKDPAYQIYLPKAMWHCSDTPFPKSASIDNHPIIFSAPLFIATVVTLHEITSEAMGREKILNDSRRIYWLCQFSLSF